MIESDLQRESPRVSIVVPAYNEGESIVRFLDRLLESVTLPCEVLVVYDTDADTTRPYVEEYANKDPRVRPTLNKYGKGPAPAIRYGFDHADANVVVVTMADGSDDPRQVDELVYLVERGVVVAAASRYMPGGQQVGGPKIKGVLSRWAGRTLHWFAGVGTRDATNSFKAYDRGVRPRRWGSTAGRPSRWAWSLRRRPPGCGSPSRRFPPSGWTASRARPTSRF